MWVVLKPGTAECQNARTPECLNLERQNIKTRNTKTRNTKLLKPGTHKKNPKHRIAKMQNAKKYKINK